MLQFKRSELSGSSHKTLKLNGFEYEYHLSIGFLSAIKSLTILPPHRKLGYFNGRYTVVQAVSQLVSPYYHISHLLFILSIELKVHIIVLLFNIHKNVKPLYGLFYNTCSESL